MYNVVIHNSGDDGKKSPLPLHKSICSDNHLEKKESALTYEYIQNDAPFIAALSTKSKVKCDSISILTLSTNCTF